MENGEWRIIAVTEGFSQGCPASPVFAALVLHEILSKIQPELEKRTLQRKAAGDLGDDGHGSIGFSLGYVDDVNAMLSHHDVEYFLQMFKKLGEPLGAILNTDKTRIMTTTTGKSLVERLKGHHNKGKQLLGHQLANTISTFSTSKVNDLSIPVEVTDGLRVLGAPIGSIEFCHQFLLEALAKA